MKKMPHQPQVKVEVYRARQVLLAFMLTFLSFCMLSQMIRLVFD